MIINFVKTVFSSPTVLVLKMAHRIWKETKQLRRSLHYNAYLSSVMMMDCITLNSRPSCSADDNKRSLVCQPLMADSVHYNHRPHDPAKTDQR